MIIEDGCFLKEQCVMTVSILGNKLEWDNVLTDVKCSVLNLPKGTNVDFCSLYIIRFPPQLLVKQINLSPVKWC